MDAGFWSAFDRAKTEMRETWRVLRVNDTRRRDQAKRPNQHAPDARRRRPTADRISAGYKTVDESLSKLPVPKPIIKDEPENRLHEGSDGLELVNDFVDDSFAPRSSSHGGPDEFEFTNVLADNIHEPKNPAKKPFSDLSHGSSVRFKFCVSEYCGMRTFDSPSGPMPPINMDFINIFAHNFWEPGVWKKSHASEIRQEMADEEGNECLFEDDDDHGSHSTSHAGLDEHASYQREFILAIGRSQRASGSPDSSMRLRQARNLWKAGIGGLHEHFERVDSHRGAWESFILQQPTEYWLLGCFAAIEEPQTMCPGKRYILSSFLPASATADSLDNFEHRRGAFQLACDQYNERQTQWMASMTQRKKYKGTFRCVQQVDGSEVDVNVSSHMTIWCRGGDGQELGIWLTVPRSACPYTWLDKRTVHFNRYGIDIRDENFSRCLSWAGHASATIPKDRFVTAGNRSELISLWESVTCLEYGPINQVLEKNQRSRQIGATARKYGPAGRPLLPTMTYMQVLNQRNYRTCLNDALWLLKEYLDFYYPNGGDFWTGSKEDFPKGNGDIERFMS